MSSLNKIYAAAITLIIVSLLITVINTIVTKEDISAQEQEIQSLITEKDYLVYINGVLVDTERILPEEITTDVYEITINHTNTSILLKTKEQTQRVNTYIPYIPIALP